MLEEKAVTESMVVLDAKRYFLRYLLNDNGNGKKLKNVIKTRSWPVSCVHYIVRQSEHYML